MIDYYRRYLLSQCGYSTITYYMKKSFSVVIIQNIPSNWLMMVKPVVCIRLRFVILSSLMTIFFQMRFATPKHLLLCNSTLLNLYSHSHWGWKMLLAFVALCSSVNYPNFPITKNCSGITFNLLTIDFMQTLYPNWWLNSKGLWIILI